MNIHHFYKDKSIFLTGGTGFIGKVLIQKLLYSLPQVNKIYLLVRNKKDKDPLTRLKQQTLKSPCFDRLRKKYGSDFQQFALMKIKLIIGDITEKNLGISKQNQADIIRNCSIFINCAANIKFDDPLYNEIIENLESALYVMQLAKAANAQIFLHTSTFGVSHRLDDGQIQESLVPIKDINGKIIDPEALYNQIKSYTPQALKIKEQEYLRKFKFQNIYLFCKGLCQNLIQKRRGTLPTSIVRPTGVYCTYSQPFPGWIDVLHAGEIMYLFMGFGVLQQIYSDPYAIFDVVPGDLVVNNILVSCAFDSGKNNLQVYHISSGDRNPLLWNQIAWITSAYWNSNPTPKRIFKPNVFVSDNKLLLTLHYMKRQIPLWFYIKLTPIIYPSQKQKINRVQRLNNKVYSLVNYYSYTFERFWIYKNRNCLRLKSWLNENQRVEFFLDCADIDMRYFILLNNYGLKRYVLKQQAELPSYEQNWNATREGKTEMQKTKIKNAQMMPKL